MNSSALLLVLVAAGIHATWNFLLKRVGATNAFTALIVPLGVVFYLPFAAAQFVLQPVPYSAGDVAALAFSSLLQLGYFVLLAYAYRLGDMSLVYPIARGSGPLLTMLGATLLLSEHPSALTVAGGILITGGMVIMTTAQRRAALGNRPAILAALGVGVMIGSYSLWDKFIVSNRGLPPIVVNWTIMVFLSMLLLPTAVQRRAELARYWREHRAITLVVGALHPLSYIMALTAMTLAPVSSVAPAREISIMIGAFLGVRLLGESMGPARLLGAAAMTAGVILLSAG